MLFILFKYLIIRIFTNMTRIQLLCMHNIIIFEIITKGTEDDKKKQ